MKTYVVVIPVAEINARKICEQIENTIVEAGQHLADAIPQLDTIEHDIYELTDFMDAINNEELFLDSAFISYVHRKVQKPSHVPLYGC